jgi:hypothetical protein
MRTGGKGQEEVTSSAEINRGRKRPILQASPCFGAGSVYFWK